MKLKDKVALVAGGGQGIGEGITLCFAEAVRNRSTLLFLNNFLMYTEQ